MILNILAHVDLFKAPIDIYFDGKYKRSSMLGIVCSLLIFSYLLFQFSTSEFFSKKSPNVVMQALKQNHAKRIDFNFENPFVIAVGDYTDTYNKIYDPSIFDISVINSIDGKINYLETKRCTYDDVPFNHSFFDALDFKNMLCLKNKNFYLEGYIDEIKMSWITVIVSACNNLTSNGTCKSPEEIESFWKNKLFAASTFNLEIDAKNLENPFRKYLEPYAFNLDPSIIKSNTMFLKTAQVETDDGWLFPNSNLQSNYLFDRVQQDFQLRTNSAEPIMRWMMFSSKETIFCTRTYQKLPETLASLGGMLNLFTVVCFLFTNVVTYVSSMRQILNEFYKFEIPKKNEKNKSTKSNVESKKPCEEIKKSTVKKFQKRSIKTETITEITNLNQIQLSIKQPDEQKNDLENVVKSEHLIKMEKNQKTLKKNDTFKSNNAFKSDTKFDTIQAIDRKLYQSPLETIKNLKEDSFIMENYSDNEKAVDVIPISEQQKKLVTSNEKTLSEEKSRFNLSAITYIMYQFRKIFRFKKNVYEKLIEKAEKVYVKDLDIKNMMNRFHDIEKLKLILLDDEQLVLFNHLAKPLISLNSYHQDEDIKNFDNRRRLSRSPTTKKSNNNFRNCLENCRANQELSAVNRRLIEFCEEKINSA